MIGTYGTSLRCGLIGLSLVLFGAAAAGAQPAGSVKLPEPRRVGPMSLEAALWARQSVRTLARDSLALADVGQLLWAAQGQNRPNGHRTAPSAGATYPLELYLLAARVRGLPAGVYQYRPAGHEVVQVSSGDRVAQLVGGALRQAWIGDAPVVFVFAADVDRTSPRYRERTERYVSMEVGFAAQNLYLEAAALGLGTTFAGSFQDSTLAQVVGLPEAQRPLGIMPVGKPR